MSTTETTNVPPPVTTPAHPAKGNQRGQTTLAAEIDRWEALANNLAPQIDQIPGLRDQLAQFQTMLTEAKELRDQLHTLKASTGLALTRRNQLLSDGSDLFTRLSLGLQGFHGPRNPNLRQFGLKPRKTRSRPRKNPIPPPATTPTVEATTAHPGPAAVPAVEAVASGSMSPGK